MDISIIVPLGSTFCCLFLLTLVLLSQQSRMRNAFSVALGLAVIRSFTSFMLHANFFPEQAVLWFGLLTVSLSASIVVYYVFVRAWANKPTGRIAYLGYGLAVVVLILFASGIYVQHAYIINGFLYVEENEFIFYAIELFGLFYCVALFYELIRRYRSLTDPAALNQANYLLIGFTIGISFGLSNAIPALRGYPVDQLGTLLFCIIITYAIVKHQLLNLRVVFREMFYLFLITVLIMLIFTAWLIPIYIYTEYKLSFGAALLAAFLSLVTESIFWNWIKTFLRQTVDRIFYGAGYPYRMELLSFVKSKVPAVHSLGEFGREFLLPLSKALDCQQVHLLLPDSNSCNFVAEYSMPDHGDASLFKIRKDSPIVKRLKQKNQCLSRDNINSAPIFMGLWTEERNTLEMFDAKLLFPLISRDNLTGILSLGNKRSGNYSLDDIDLVERVNNQLAASLEKEYLQERLRNREQELALINKLISIITSSLHIQDVYKEFIAGLKDVVNIDWSAVTLVEEDDLQFEALYTEVGSPWQEGEKIKLKNAAIDWNKKTLLEPDISHECQYSMCEELIELGIHSVVYLPFVVKGKVIGNLIIASRMTDAYDPDHIKLLERLANQISVSVENSRLYATAEQRSRVDELTQLFNRRYFDECLEREIKLRSRYGGFLSVISIDLDRFKDYNDKYGHPYGDKVLTRLGSAIKQAVRSIDFAFRYGGDEFAIILPETDVKDAHIVADRVRVAIDNEMWNKETGITASLGVATWPNDGVTPNQIVTAADRALYYAKRTGGDRTCTVSEMLSIPGRNDPQDPREDKEKLSMIYALAATIEARDHYTYGHSRNVRRYAVALAEALGLPSENVAVIGTAALLHDIGKIGVPDGVLKKADMLTGNEWDLIKSHPRLSAAIVGHVLSLTSCLPAILHHHEWWNGKGYPSGLKGEAIPLEARILAVADAFEAMTSARPYRGSMPIEVALEDLKRCAGIQFDPTLVDIFLSIDLHLSTKDEVNVIDSLIERD